MITPSQEPARADWSRIETWLFDLDNTLYHPATGILDQVNVQMTAYIADRLAVTEAEASRLRHGYWQRHGATLTGMVNEHGIDPDDFLDTTHRLDLSALAPDPALARAITALPGRRIVHTNGPRAHAERVLTVLGLDHAFERVITIEDTGYVPKPAEQAHRTAVDLVAIAPAAMAMIDDMAPNLHHPAAMGMTTIWLDHHADESGHDHVHHQITDLAAFLTGVATGGMPDHGRPRGASQDQGTR